MCPDLYKRLGLKDEDLTKYDTPLVGFDGKIVMVAGQIKLPMVTEGKKVMVNFIVVHAFSPAHGDLCMAMDSFHRSRFIHIVPKSKVPG